METASEIESRLIAVTKRITDRHLDFPDDILLSRTLDELGLDSLTTLSLLVAIEDEFGIEWNEDLPEGTLKSLPSIASYIRNELDTSA